MLLCLGGKRDIGADKRYRQAEPWHCRLPQGGRHSDSCYLKFTTVRKHHCWRHLNFRKISRCFGWSRSFGNSINSIKSLALAVLQLSTTPSRPVVADGSILPAPSRSNVVVWWKLSEPQVCTVFVGGLLKNLTIAMFCYLTWRGPFRFDYQERFSGFANHCNHIDSSDVKIADYAFGFWWTLAWRDSVVGSCHIEHSPLHFAPTY